ncbi:MAG: PH domain-containing protein [Pirellulales bacterium]
MKCGKCGAKVADDAAFCSQCGARMESKRRVTDLDEAADDAISDDATSGGRTPAANRLRARGRSGAAGQRAEEDLWSGTFSPKAMIGPAIVCVLLSVAGLVGVIVTGGAPPALPAFGVAMLVIWGWLGLTLLYRRLTVRYRLTTYRLFHDTGLFARTGNRIEVIDIDDVTVRQGIIERMFGIGSINIASSDRTDPTLNLPGIDNVREVADLIDGTRRAERQRRGLHIESI